LKRMIHKKTFKVIIVWKSKILFKLSSYLVLSDEHLRIFQRKFHQLKD